MSIHDYFMGLGVDEIRRRGAEDDKPLRMVKTILHELCKLKVKPPASVPMHDLSVYPTISASRRLRFSHTNVDTMQHNHTVCQTHKLWRPSSLIFCMFYVSPFCRGWISRSICGISHRIVTLRPSSASMWTSTCKPCTRQASYQGQCPCQQGLLRSQPFCLPARPCKQLTEATLYPWVACRAQVAQGNGHRLCQMRER